MVRLGTEDLRWGAGDLLSRPRCIVDHRRLGDPGDPFDLPGGHAIGELLRVEEVPLAHVDVAPDVRERLCQLLDGERTVFLHYVE
ncbi:hypothetical protein [Halobaculum lipolyticum]|uniref:Uncharacterized protein n=1 Tax=Halobaculum lipolyticum TaxID=3032001 RepID=A0ABD5W706_9EURY|nr:hypothetical protein [Halobaculum sp. DT31]